jgi:Ca2+-binding EF-hand superfamily protein
VQQRVTKKASTSSIVYDYKERKEKMADRDLSEDEVADLKEAFAMFDINGDGMSRL